MPQNFLFAKKNRFKIVNRAFLRAIKLVVNVCISVPLVLVFFNSSANQNILLQYLILVIVMHNYIQSMFLG